VSANLSKVPPNEKGMAGYFGREVDANLLDRSRGYTLDKFQILFYTVPTSIETLNLKQQWDGMIPH
jgi:hypothetical protein